MTPAELFPRRGTEDECVPKAIEAFCTIWQKTNSVSTGVVRIFTSRDILRGSSESRGLYDGLVILCCPDVVSAAR